MTGAALTPTSAREREPILDVLRGFALLGILLVNISLMRGSELYAAFFGELPEPSTGLDRVVGGAVSWFAAGKFVSSFSILFGLGAGLIVNRSLAAGHDPRGLLARRYAWLLVFGLAHMLLLFPGDILFAYGLTGMVLLAFVNVRPTVALWWSAGLLAAVTLVTTAFAALATVFEGMAGEAPADDPVTTAFEDFFVRRQDQAVSAFTEGSYLDIIVVNAWQSLFIQAGQLFVIPWILALFLFGFAVTRLGIPRNLEEHRTTLRRAAAAGLGLGLPLNAVLGLVDPLTLISGGAGDSMNAGVLVAVSFVQQAGAPLLAVGYLAGLALLSLRIGAVGPLAAVGRMALSAYLTQSLLALVVFAGLSQYDQLDSAASLLVVLAIWAILLLACPLWLRRFRFGPAEWLWRSLTYGQRQPMRRHPTDARQTD